MCGVIGENAGVESTRGKRAGSRKAAAPSGSVRVTALLAGACLFLVIAWWVLVRAAIDFGRSARDGDGLAWLFLAVASLGAMACLFAGLLVGVRLLVALGVLREVPAVAGGRRAKR